MDFSKSFFWLTSFAYWRQNVVSMFIIIIQNVQIDLSFVEILFIKVLELGSDFSKIDSGSHNNLGLLL